MDSSVQITLIVCLTIISVYGMSLFKENKGIRTDLSSTINGTRRPNTSTGKCLKNIKPPKAGSGIKDTSKIDTIFKNE